MARGGSSDIDSDEEDSRPMNSKLGQDFYHWGLLK